MSETVMRQVVGTDVWVECTTDCSCVYPDAECECPVTCLRCWASLWDDDDQSGGTT